MGTGTFTVLDVLDTFQKWFYQFYFHCNKIYTWPRSRHLLLWSFHIYSEGWIIKWFLIVYGFNFVLQRGWTIFSDALLIIFLILSFWYFSTGSFVSTLHFCRNFLNTLDVNPLLVIRITNAFPQHTNCIFTC